MTPERIADLLRGLVREAHPMPEWPYGRPSSWPTQYCYGCGAPLGPAIPFIPTTEQRAAIEAIHAEHLRALLDGA